MPKTSRSRSSGRVPDISSASIAELTRLPAEVLRLHLSSRNLITTGKKAILARRLHEALHLTVPATTANSASSVTAPPPATTQTSINSSTPTTVTVTSTTNPSTITELPPALQQQFSTRMQQYISNAALQPNLSPASDCTSTPPQSVNAAALTFTQASANYTSATNAPLYQVAGHRPAMYQLPAPLQLQNPQHTHPQQPLRYSKYYQPPLYRCSNYYQPLLYRHSNYYQPLLHRRHSNWRPLLYYHSTMS